MSDDHDPDTTGNGTTARNEPGAEGADAPGRAEQPVCAICGHEIAPDDVVCPSCGTSLVAG
ncbi:MAG TPA: zinc-ribbon domain-containing protein [Thermomicrobiales bacterium]|nr:zinc-ribbon domain-containing protein [Thermomicrobiales bacterium]